ncbi:FadR/GntR family transcriptional regulator [Rhodococcus globerulus]|uniref:FadR/GntR family transcriptional regulator n=1 Tax=Rhodococcus globerulus TaxID=33008 RepID=UPI0005AA96D3|nr:FadR/GntR family transcriptional regulator [Rhodococcus globerulus]MCE4266303.1 FadR family transcriptional regulator [Rhodococcus globerulus]
MIGPDAPVGGLGGLGPLKVPRPADVLAENIRARILTGELPVGSRLPAERLLVEESGLARSSVREALAQLQSQGLIIVKTGRRGGSIVSRPSAEAFTDSVRVHLEGWAPSTEHLMESRQVIEPWCAFFAAARRTDDDIAKLRAINEQTARALEGNGDFVEGKTLWHQALSRASHNEVLSTLMEAVSQSVFQQFDESTLRGDDDDMKRSLDDHIQITDAIADGRQSEAFHLVGAHLRTPPIIWP